MVEAATLVDTLADTLAEVEAETVVSTPDDVEAKALFDTLAEADTPAEV